MNTTKCVVLLFSSGKSVITGGRSEKEILEIFESIYPIIFQFVK